MNGDDDHLTKLHLELPNHWWHKSESIWARALGSDRYEIRNVPFCAYGLNFGDVVLATADQPDLKPEVRRVVAASGHRTLRIFFSEGVERAQQVAQLDQLVTLGAQVERADARFVCLDLRPCVDYQACRQALDAMEAAGVLAYETCETRTEGSFDDRPRDN